MQTIRAADGTELAVVDRGAGPPILLVHGFPLTHAMWQAQIDALAPRLRVLAPDLRGFGRSGASEPKVTMEQFADDLVAVLDGLGVGEPVTLCGLSMGGYVALQFWRKHAHRLRAVVFCDTRATADTPEAAAGRAETADRVLREGPGFLVETMIPKLLAESTQREKPELVEAVGRMIAGGDPRGIAAAARGMAERPDMTERLGQIACPRLLIVGRHDPLSSPAEMRSMADAMQGASMVEIARAAHLPPMENPAEFNAALAAFVAELG